MQEREALAKQLADAITITIQISPPGPRSELSAALGASEDDVDTLGKHTKTEADYRSSDDDSRRCGNCTHFFASDSCDIVSGVIDEDDVCNYFAKEPARRKKDKK